MNVLLIYSVTMIVNEYDSELQPLVHSCCPLEIVIDLQSIVSAC